MKEEVREVKTYKVIARCECGGQMKPTGVVLSTYPAQYPHVCDRCGQTETYFKEYPTYVYGYVEEGE